jgi:predicted TIM-barrel fold metal-dependent hydrolase
MTSGPVPAAGPGRPLTINSHVHMQRLGKEFSDELADFYMESNEGRTCWHTGQPWRKEDFCVPADRLIADMDRLGIDKSFVLGIAFLPYNAYDPEAAEYAAGMVERYPDRLIGFYTANPGGGYAEAKRFERGIETLGLSGLKLLPAGNRLALNDRRMWPLFEVAQGHRVPIVMHTGWNGFPRGRVLEWEHPMYLEDVLLDFPDLKIVMAHLGFQWADEALWLMARSPSLYGDLAFWDESVPLWRLAQVCSSAKKLGVLDRILWGSDYPFMAFEPGMELFRRVPGYTQRHELEPFVTEEDLGTYFGGAAARLIGLTPEPASRRLTCD